MCILIPVCSSLLIPFITVRDKLCWKILFCLFSLALDKGLAAPGDAEVLPQVDSEQCSFQKHWFNFQQVLLKHKGQWSSSWCEPASMVPVLTAQNVLMAFSAWRFYKHFSALLRNNSPTFKRLALGLERRVVYHNNYGSFFQEGWFVCVFSCFGVEGQCDKQYFLFQCKMATL